MATECQLPFSDEDSKLLDEARERAEQGYSLSQETLDEVMPEIYKTNAEAAQRDLAFEQNEEDREIIKEILRISPEENEKIEQEKQGAEITTFRTLSGEFAIRQTPGSHLTTEEVRRIYREETPHCVIEGIQKAAHINRVKEYLDKQGKTKITLGDHRRSFYRLEGDRWAPEKKAEIFLYRHTERILEKDTETRMILREGNPEKIRGALAWKERETHYHEIGEEIYDTHLTVEEKEECAKMYQKAIKGGWMRDICDHSEPSYQQYVCDAYKMFRANPPELKSIDEEMFRFVQNKVISLEVKDTFTSLEGKEDKEEDENNET